MLGFTGLFVFASVARSFEFCTSGKGSRCWVGYPSNSKRLCYTPDLLWHHVFFPKQIQVPLMPASGLMREFVTTQVASFPRFVFLAARAYRLAAGPFSVSRRGDVGPRPLGEPTDPTYCFLLPPFLPFSITLPLSMPLQETFGYCAPLGAYRPRRHPMLCLFHLLGPGGVASCDPRNIHPVASFFTPPHLWNDCRFWLP